MGLEKGKTGLLCKEIPLMTLLRCSVDSASETARMRRGLDISILLCSSDVLVMEGLREVYKSWAVRWRGEVIR